MSSAPPAAPASPLNHFLSPASSNLLPPPLLARLADAGCCARCVLRLGGLRDVATFARPGAELEAALVAAFAGASPIASSSDGESKSDPPSSSSSSSADADASSASEASSASAASASASAPAPAASATDSSTATDAPTAMDTSAATAGTVFTHAAPCVGCLGVLEDATLEAAAQRVRRDLDSGGYACSDYSLVASVLPSVLLRQFAMSCYAQSLITSGTSGTTGAADTGGAAGTGGAAAARPPFVDPLGSRNLLDMPTLAKARLSAVLQTTLPGAVLRVDSSLKIAVAFTHPDNVAECGCLPAPADAKAVARKRKRRDVAPSTLSLATLRKALASVVADSRYAKTPPAEACVARLVDWGMAVPPANPASAAACGCTVHVQRGPLFVSGNYRKLARGLSQTPWFVEGQRRGDSSVSEHIGDVIAPLWGATEYKFHSAGREDIDVRMLGDGRPFVIELLDARHGAEVSSSSWEVVREAVGGVAASALATPPSMQHVQGVINEATDDVEVSGLSFVPSSVFQALKDGADSKRKNYCCVVALSKPATATQLAQLSAHKDLLVLQQTPVRVLHRRTQMVREKIVHDMECEFINGRFFILKMTTSAGMYVKEFVHGDLGRTQPNVGSLLGCEADILQLDVLSLIMKQ